MYLCVKVAVAFYAKFLLSVFKSFHDKTCQDSLSNCFLFEFWTSCCYFWEFYSFVIHLTSRVGSPSYSAKSRAISSTPWTRVATREAKEWGEETWSLACLWGLTGEYCPCIVLNSEHRNFWHSCALSSLQRVNAYMIASRSFHLCHHLQAMLSGSPEKKLSLQCQVRAPLF